MVETLKNIKTDCEMQKIASNLSNLMESRNMSVNQLADEVGLPMMTVRRLMLGTTIDPRVSTLKLITDYFNITLDSLLEKNNSALIGASKKALPFFVPILSWEITEKIKSIKELDLITWKEWQPISLNAGGIIGPNSFALESRPSMYPRFPQETLFIIDPDLQPNDGDIVLVKIKDNNEVTLRELKIDPPDWLLQPITVGSNIILFNKNNHKIIGINLLTILYNKRIYS